VAKGLTRESIVDAALDLLDEQGIDALTLRALAARLGVRAPALYWHVASKQELLDEMGTEIQRRVQAAMTAAPIADWRDGLAHYGRVLRQEYLAHRDGARTFSGTRLTDPEVLRAQEPWLAQWTAAGLDLRDAVDAAELVTAFVVGFVIEEQERAQSAASDPGRYAVDQRDAALGEDVPLVTATAHLRDDPDSRFERQFQILLTGLAALEPRP
jgi:AcrR family transcriptional regulator